MCNHTPVPYIACPTALPVDEYNIEIGVFVPDIGYKAPRPEVLILHIPESGQYQMHRRVSWLTAADYPILQFLADLDGYWIKPSSMSLNLPYGRQAVASHCATLAEHGLVERHADVAAYRIVEKGRAYLRNELSVEDLQETSVENEDKDKDEDGDEDETG